MYSSARFRFTVVAVNLLFCVTLLELLSLSSSWKITRKCPYGHYFNNGCVTCWCDTNTGQTNCQRSSSCNRVNVKCQNGKVYKDECGNSCNCHEETGAVFCSNSNPQCPKMKLRVNKEDLENTKSTTSKPIIPKIIAPVLPPIKNNAQIFQPVMLRRSPALNKPLPLYDMDYSSSGGPTIISLYEKIKRLMSKKIKETIDDVIKDELRKPFSNIFPRPVLENSNFGVNYASENVRPLSTHFPEKKPVSETIEDEVPKSGYQNPHEVFVKAPSGSVNAAKKSPLNYGEKSDDLKESYVREPLLGSERSESQKVLTFSHPSHGTIRPILSNFEDRIKLNLGSSFHNTSPKPFSYNTFQVNTPSFTYEESSPKAATMNFSERTPTRTPSFTFEKSTPGFTLAQDVHQSTSQPRIYNIILNTPRPYLYDNQSNSSKPIIHEFGQSTTPQYSNFHQYSTARKTFLESIGTGITPRPTYRYYSSTLQPSIYDFEGHAQKYNSYDKSHQRQNHLHQSYIPSGSTPISTLYDFPQSTPKPFNANFNHGTQKTMQHSFHQNAPKPIIRLIFQQSTSKPPSFVVRNHHGRFSTNKPGNSNYLRTTSIADPSRFIFHQMTTKRPNSPVRLHSNTPPIYQHQPAYHNNYNSQKPSFTNVSPVYSSPSMNVNKGSSFVYIFHETKPRNNIYSSAAPQNNNNFHRQPLLQNPSTVIPQFITSPSRLPNNFVKMTPRPITKTTPGNINFISNSNPIFEMTSIGHPVTASYNFEHLSPNPIAHRLEDEIPKPMNFDFQENTPEPEHVSFNANHNKPAIKTNANIQTRKPVILKYKNWASALSTTVPTTVRPTSPKASTTRRPKIKTTKVPVDFTYPPPTRAYSAPAIKINNHGTRTDNTEYDYNSHKIDNSNTPINYSSSNEGVSSSSVSPVLTYDYMSRRPETPIKSTSPEQEEEINHEEMIPKELILDPHSGPMTVVFDHDRGQQSLKFSDRKGHDPVVTFSQDNPQNPIEVEIETTSVKPTKVVDLEEILEKEPEEEYQPVFVELEKEEKKTPIVVIKSESGNKNIEEYRQESNLREPITYYENQESIIEKQAEEPLDVHLAVTPSDIVTYEEEHLDVKENYENLESNDKHISDIEDREDKVESLDYDSENQQEPSTFVNQEEQPQETFVMNEYEQEQPKEFDEEVMESNPQFERITPNNYGNENGENEQSFDDTQQEILRDSTAEVNATPINFDFPNHELETTPATNMYDDQGESSDGYATESNHYYKGNQHQFMHKSGEELLSELPLVENKGEILRFKFAKDEKVNKKPLLVSFKKQSRPYRANAFLKTDAIAGVFSFYHKMRQESAKRAIAAAEKRRLEVPYDDNSSQEDYFRNNYKRSQFTNDESKKVSGGTDTDTNTRKKSTHMHSRGFAETLKSESTSNARASLNERRDRHNLNKDMADKLDWKLEIEV